MKVVIGVIVAALAIYVVVVEPKVQRWRFRRDQRMFLATGHVARGRIFFDPSSKTWHCSHSRGSACAKCMTEVREEKNLL